MVAAISWAFTAVTGLTGGLTIAGIGLTTAAGGLTLAGTLVNAAILTAVSGGFSKPKGVTATDVQQVFVQTIGARIVHIGQVKTGGQVVFRRAKNGFYHQVTTHGHGGPYEIVNLLLNDEEVAVDENNFVSGAFSSAENINIEDVFDPDRYISNGTPRVYLEVRTGQVPEMYYSKLEASYPAWDSSHRLDGQCTTYLRREQVPAEEYQEMFTPDPPELSVILRRKDIYDPRNDTTGPSDNPALCIAWFIQSPLGLNRLGSVNEDWLIAAADDYDDAIPLAAGGTEPRGCLSLSYALTEDKREVLKRMLAACGADVKLLPDGTFGIRSSKYAPPNVTLTKRHIKALVETNNGPGLLKKFTRAPYRYVDRSLGYLETAGAPYINAALETKIGGARVGAEQDYTGSPSATQSMRMAKQHSFLENPDMMVTIICHPRAIIAKDERLVTIDYGAVSGVYLIAKPPSINPLTLECTFSLIKFDDAVNGWTTAEEPAPKVLPDADTPGTIAPLSNFNAGSAGIQAAQNTWVAAIGVAWDQPAVDYLTPYIEYSAAGQDEWTEASTTPSQSTVLIDGLIDGNFYDVRGCLVTLAGTKGSFVTETNVVALALSGSPDAPTGLTVVDNTDGTATVSVTSSASEGNWKTFVYRGGVEIFNQTTEASVPLSFTDSPGAGTYDYTAKALNVSSVPSVLTATVTQTIT